MSYSSKSINIFKISYFIFRVLQLFMISNDQLAQLDINQTKINFLFYAMTFFIQKFDDNEITLIFFKIFFSNSIDKKLFLLSDEMYQDPPFYSFEYKNQDVIGIF